MISFSLQKKIQPKFTKGEPLIALTTGEGVITKRGHGLETNNPLK